MDIGPLVARVDRFQQLRRWTAVPVAVIKKYGDDRGSQLAALVTYYAFLALFPLLLVFITVLGFVLDGHPDLQRDLVDSALRDFPVIGVQLRRNVHALSGQGVAFVIGLIVLVWGALGVAHTTQHVMATVWGIPERARPGFLPRILRSVALLAVLAVGVVVTTALSGVLAVVANGAIVRVAGLVLAAALNVGVYVAAMRIVTVQSVATPDLMPGAVLGGIAWTILQLLGTWLVARQLQHTSELYGFFAIVLGLLFWLYFAAQVMVYSAEVSAVVARRLWPRSLAPPPLTPADEAALTLSARAEERRPEEHIDVRFD